jgi:hypothetical protein
LIFSLFLSSLIWRGLIDVEVLELEKFVYRGLRFKVLNMLDREKDFRVECEFGLGKKEVSIVAFQLYLILMFVGIAAKWYEG